MQFIGLIAAYSSEVIIDNIVTEGCDIKAMFGKIGGIVGFSGHSTIKNCVNKASITIETVNMNIGVLSGGGGIACYCATVSGVSSDIVEKAGIFNCENYGIIEGAGIVFYNDTYVGGCINYADLTGGGIAATSTLTGGIYGCINVGNIKGEAIAVNNDGNCSYCGNCGYVESGTMHFAKGLSYNMGTIVWEEETMGYCYRTSGDWNENVVLDDFKNGNVVEKLNDEEDEKVTWHQGEDYPICEIKD